MVQIFGKSKCDMVLRHKELKRNHLIMVLVTFPLDGPGVKVS